MDPAELIATLDATLVRISRLAPENKASWDADDLRQLAIERLWITAGNLAEHLTRGAVFDRTVPRTALRRPYQLQDPQLMSALRG